MAKTWQDIDMMEILKASLSHDTASCFLTMCPRVHSAQEKISKVSVICEFCHRVGRVMAAHEAEMGLSDLCFG